MVHAHVFLFWEYYKARARGGASLRRACMMAMLPVGRMACAGGHACAVVVPPTLADWWSKQGGWL